MTKGCRQCPALNKWDNMKCEGHPRNSCMGCIGGLWPRLHVCVFIGKRYTRIRFRPERHRLRVHGNDNED